MPTKTDQELEATRQRLHEIVWPMFTDEKCLPKPWKLKYGKDRSTTGLVFRGTHKKFGTVWRVEAELPLSVQQFVEIFGKKLKPADWVPHVTEFKILEAADDLSWEIQYTLTANVPAIDDRDFVGLRLRKRLEDGSIYELSESTTHPTCPKRPKIIRAEYLPSGTLIRPVSENRCHVIWLNNVDLKGLLPKKVIRLATTSAMEDFLKAVFAKTKEMAPLISASAQ